MKKKLVASIAAVTLSLGLVLGGTLAWFTGEAKTDATFKAGTVKIGILKGEEDVNNKTLELIKNWNPGDSNDYDYLVPNLGTKRAYVRVELSGMQWLDTQLANSNVTITPDANWIKATHDDGNGVSRTFYYYKNIVNPDAAANLKLNVSLDGASTGNEYQGKTFTVKVKADAIQASNGAIKSAWNIPDAVLSQLEAFVPTP